MLKIADDIWSSSIDSLGEINKDKIDGQIQLAMRSIQNLLTIDGWYVESNVILKGKSGQQHHFDAVASSKTKRVFLSLLQHKNAEATLNAMMRARIKSIDCSLDSVLIGFISNDYDHSISNMAETMDISVVQHKDIQSIINMLRESLNTLTK